MNISGIRPVVGFYDYNEIQKTQRMPADDMAIQTDVSQEQNVSQEVVAVNGRTPEVEKGQTFGAYDYANQYNPEVTYRLKGAESDIRSLDVERALSDMQKDEVIHQYQYFVGQDMATNLPDRVNVRGGEDFSL